MSLLLDALKKAAKEKKTADENDGANDHDDLHLDEIEHSEQVVEDTPAKPVQQEATEQNAAKPHTRESHQTNNVTPDPQTHDNEPEHDLTISSEALNMLVHKAKKRYKDKERHFMSIIILSSLTIILVGGAYYYLSLSEEIESIERKHDLVMRTVTDTSLSKSVTEKIERQREREAEELRKKQAAEELVSKQKESTYTSADQDSKRPILISKSKKKDPISEQVRQAWEAYSQERYDEALATYNKVLVNEKTNRDALLGVAAIAIKQQDTEKAISVYSYLKELDPRDPIATAALTNLQGSPGTMQESRLKYLIGQNSGSATLYFALGNLLSQQKRWAEAQQAYFNAWRGEENNAIYAYNLAISLDQLGKKREAVKFYNLSLENAGVTEGQVPSDVIRQRLSQLGNGKR